MFEAIFKIWFTIAVLPFLIFLEANTMFAKFLKKNNIYAYWDIWHSFIIVLLLFLTVLWVAGVR